ncbi:hypothetical protein BTM25_32930 [Actinomadura rubteroloni]|uniref:Uncharacterized protein n=1 Tax=Actinomadura rubteroloni TaxID=1926885 RepID=A0A2P4UHX6_9ACTN|nr:hypothetical protein [Actinomadura rubteroloni]POM24659.1 hypothetical protein BTM25_32930 [Actinomadura rubteroloni]
MTTKLIAVLIAVALLDAACSGKTPGKAVPSLGTSKPSATAATGKPDLLEFARCMRRNGVPDFKDPDASGGVGITRDQAQSPVFKAADKACHKYVGAPPGGGQQPHMENPWPAAQQLKYAQCMRTHGFPQFPDPSGNGEPPMIDKNMGIDPDSPTFQAADKACAAFRPKNVGRAGGPKAAQRAS